MMPSLLSKTLFFTISIVLIAGCRRVNENPSVASISGREYVKSVLESIDGDTIAHHVNILSSDAFEGRRPTSNGESLTLSYLAGELERYNLEPGTKNGYLQPFPMNARSAKFEGELGEISLQKGRDILVPISGNESSISFENTPVVFGGYGIVSQEHDRDDFQGVDLTGAVVLMFAGYPPGDERFEGLLNTDKSKVLAERGALAEIFIVLDDNIWPNMRDYFESSFLTEFDEPWWPLQTLFASKTIAEEALALQGTSVKTATEEAAEDSYQASRWHLPLNGHLEIETRALQSHNVVAELRGADPELAQEWIVLSAHWDHLGMDTTLSVDQIYNGAMDNATGSAVLLEIARAASILDRSPRRSLLFLWTGAEEFGLLGAKTFAENPIYPIEQIVAAVNFDFQAALGLSHDMIVINPGNTTIEDALADVLATQGREIGEDPWPDQNFYERSDHFAFAEKGIPAIFPGSGINLVEGGSEAGLRLNEEYAELRYHKVGDEVLGTWDYRGLEQDTRAFFLLALAMAEQTEPPVWKETTQYPEFREIHQNR